MSDTTMNEELEEYKNKVRQVIFQIDGLLQSISYVTFGKEDYADLEEPLTILEELFVPAPIVITKDSRVDEIGLVTRGAACALKRNGYTTVKDLTKASYYDVLSTANFGELGMSELVRVLSSSGFTLKNAPKYTG